MADEDVKTCFVSMPFGVKEDHQTGEAIDFDSVYQLIISPAAQSGGFSTMRADSSLPSGRILDQVIDMVMAADLFIGDISTQNPNVFYEIGLRHMTAKPCLLIARRGHQIPFDLAGYRVFMYSEDQNHLGESREGLSVAISALLSSSPAAGSPVSPERLLELHRSNTNNESREPIIGGLTDTLSSIERRLFSLETNIAEFAERSTNESLASVAYLDKGKPKSRRIFVVHGRSEIADSLRTQVVTFLVKLEFEPVILSEQAEGGRALPHKLDQEMADIGYAFVLLTPDDVGAHCKEAEHMRPRARQNVIYEHGLFVGRMGLPRICAIQMGDVELPSDLSGIIPKVLSEGEAVSN